MIRCSKCNSVPNEHDVIGWKCNSCGKAFQVTKEQIHSLLLKKETNPGESFFKCKFCGATLDDGKESIAWKCSCGNITMGKLADFGEDAEIKEEIKEKEVKQEKEWINIGIIQKEIDINAHIEKLQCEVNTDNGIAKISFTNLGYGDITAIKFNACGYNSFGDIVPVNGKDKFFLIIQDMIIRKNETVTDLKAKLPNHDMKKLDLVECQICYADGTVVSYEGNNSYTFELEEINSPEQLNALHKLYDENAKFKPKDFEQGWICSCGRFNKHDKNVCSLCNKNKTDTIKICSDENLKRLVEEYKISEEKDKQAREAEQARLEKEKKKRNIIIGIAIVVCIILAFPIGNSIITSQKTTYSSEEEMKEALQGKYTYYKNGSAYRQIEIKDDQFRYIYSNIESNHWMDIDWFPEEGKIHTFEDIMVTNEGDLKVDGELYKKGGYMSTKDDYLSTYTSESGYSVLKISDLTWDNNSSYNVCTGKVKNTGEKTYYFVTVKGSFKDSSGNVLDTDSTYAVGSEGLAPGESSSFRLSVKRDYDITDCSVLILDFDN